MKISKLFVSFAALLFLVCTLMGCGDRGTSLNCNSDAVKKLTIWTITGGYVPRYLIYAEIEHEGEVHKLKSAISNIYVGFGIQREPRDSRLLIKGGKTRNGKFVGAYAIKDAKDGSSHKLVCEPY